MFCGCSRQITINFMVKDQIAFSVTGKSPIILNEQNFQIDDEMINLYDWIDEKGTPIDFSQPFKKDTTIYSNATFNYYIYFQANGQNYDTKIVEEGKPIVQPERIPTIDGFIFTGWKDSDGNLLDENTVCSKDTTYIAQYKETVEKIIIVNDVLFCAIGVNLDLICFCSVLVVTVSIYDSVVCCYARFYLSVIVIYFNFVIG